MYNNDVKKTKVVLCMLAYTRNDDIERDLCELHNLVDAAGGVEVGRVFQKGAPEPTYLIGTGKVEELKNVIKETGAELVVFDNQLTGSKIKNLEDYVGVKVIDRAILILDIFSLRALSNEGKLQVELAQMKYNLPRLNALSGTTGRYGSGGIGMRGPGESKIELNRRIIENSILDKQRELDKLKQDRDLRRSNRFNSKKKVVAIVGYTNSGKSTLLNTITKANVLAKDMLFATLDTTTRSVWLGPNKEIMLVDTVGFVNKLPHELIEAFSSTLEETLYADLLIHVVDIANEKYKIQQEVVLNVLENLGVKKDVPIITIYNKTDVLLKTNNFPAYNIKITNSKNGGNEEQLDPNAIFVSAKNNINIDVLKDRISEILFGKDEEKDE